MNHLGYLYLSTLLTLWVILDPPGLLPVFLSLTRRMSPHQRNAAAVKASLVAVAVIGSFGLFGQYIFSYLHISVGALQVSGGLLLLLVALELLTGKFDTVEEQEVPDTAVNVAIVPLGTPLLAGPGAIVATMLAVESTSGVKGSLVVFGAVFTAMVLVYAVLRFAEVVRAFLKDAGITLLTRIAGLLLSAIAVQMMADGVLSFFK
ncbi:MAG: MarC family protein [Actinomycetia bacterium]|nr:MarC family protein [Actinomycetes bacterium]